MQFLNVLLQLVLAFTSVFLICLVLIQRGKGGGLAGAFGGAGGSSAFGTKAGDIFTRVTMIVAGVWISIAMLLVVLSNRRTSAYGDAPAAKSTFTPSPSADGKSKLPIESLDKSLGLPPTTDSSKVDPPGQVSGTSPIAPNTPLKPITPPSKP
ncbi:preprotein translocase subunit SecG [Tundrisphaera lichenicola]|uniref:preprotein translocase subunit SecG n=1 Tax=Tundrisphaera lichenicola TaxID=2029860 RepID=UPI003EBB5206